MENRDTSKAAPVVSWQALVLVAAIASNLFWATPLLRSSRPSVKSPGELRSLGKQDVDARLWQDPFQAIGPQALKSAVIVTNDAAHAVEDLASQIQQRGSPHVTILPVMVTGFPYAEDSEWRLRSRYAVISALNVCNYVPEDAQHIGFIRVPWPNNLENPSETTNHVSAAANDPALVVPYEWFVWTDFHTPYPPSRRGAADDVLVLWLRDELFSDHPLSRLATLVSLLKLGPPQNDGTKLPNITVKVMGPYGSTTLQAMYLDALNGGQQSSYISNTLGMVETQIYSASATAADAFVTSRNYLSLAEGHTRREAVSKVLQSAGVEFVNCTCTDQDLAEAMLAELGRRRVKLEDPRHGIVMISEEDTFYGRSLPATFELELKKHRACEEAWPSQWVVQHYTYLRGLDGKAASGDAAGEKVNTAEKKPDATSGRPDGLERPENSGQLDYVRRLVDRIERDCAGYDIHARHAGKAPPPALKAIGIVGSDVYDKLLLLQLLRKQFPNVLFFTTDLDARLFHPQELKASRNVLVASSFGLELAPDLQHDIPPFRDTYQTALFLATCVGLGSVDPEKLSQLTPRLFEIGQLGAVDISLTEPEIHPRRENYGSWRDAWCLNPLFCLVPVLGVISLCQVLPVRRRFRMGGPTRRFAAGFLLGLGLMAVVLFGLSLYLDYSDPAGEPVLLLSGVSLWPTEIVRLITAFLCFFWLLMTAHKLEQDSDKLKNDFGLDPVLTDKQATRHWTEKFRIARWKPKQASGEAIETGFLDKRICAMRLWQDYAYLGSSRNRMCRIALASLVYLAFGVLVITINPPFFPGRGHLSFVVDKAMMIVLVIGFILLMFAVVDATRLCARMVENLSSWATDWSEASYRKFQKNRPVPQAYLRDWMDTKFVAARTQTVVRLIYYPFIIIFLMILSRSHFFDAWDWPWGLRIVIGIGAAYAFCCAVSLRVTAEKARQRALDRMRDKLVLIRAGQVELDGAKLEKAETKTDKSEPEKDSNGILVGRKELETELKDLIEEVKGIQEGAFAPWSRQPLVGALIMPFTGAGLVALLQYLATSY